MHRSTGLFTILMVLLLVLVTAALVWRVQAEKDQFIEHQQFIMQKQVEITAKNIEAQVNSLRDRMIAISLDSLWLKELKEYSRIEDMQQLLHNRFRLYFPSMKGFGIADEHGEILWSDLDFFVSGVCRHDLEKSAQMLTLESHYFDYKTYLHPQPGNYHFDMIFPVFWNEQKRVFFMSFSPASLIQSLKESRISEHGSFLLRTDRVNLIEISEEGVREVFSRPFFLQENEAKRIRAKLPVANTKWEVAVIENPKIFARFEQKLIWDALIIWSVFVLLWLALLWFALHYQRRQGHLFKRLNHLSMHDELTGVANRRKMVQALQQALEALKRNGLQSGMLYLDLDNFKPVNDRFGHDLGDKLLQQFAQRLQKQTRVEDLVARLGGDEFVVLFHKLSTVPEEANEQLKEMTERYKNLLNEPYLIDGNQIICHCSIGRVLLLPHMNNVDELLKHGDFAMYEQKQKSKRSRSDAN